VNANELTVLIDVPTDIDFPTANAYLTGYLGNPEIITQLTAQPFYDQSAFASAHDYFCQIAIDATFFCPFRRTARAISDTDDSVYAYYMTFIYKYIQENFPSYGAFHGEELPFVFADPNPPSFNGIPLKITPQEYSYFSALFQNYYNNFVLNGNPVRITANDPEWCPFWPKYDSTKGRSNAEKVLNITNNNPKVFKGGIEPFHCEFWDKVQPLLNVQNPNPTPAPTHRPHHYHTKPPVHHNYEEHEFLDFNKKEAKSAKNINPGEEVIEASLVTASVVISVATHSPFTTSFW